jgi:spore maturation protein CgeB
VKLVIFGLTVSSSWGNGHATLWRGLCRALEHKGHNVVFFERDVPFYRADRDLTAPTWGELQLFTRWEDILPVARTHLADADVAIVTSYCPDALEAAGIIADADVPLRVFYDLDTPVTLERVRAGEPVDYIGPQGLADYDLVLSYTGGRALEELQTLLGARRVAPLYGFVDPAAHFPVAADPGWRADLSYLGTFAEDRQATLEELFIEPARQLPDRRFLMGGAQYPDDFPWTSNVFFVRHVAPPRHPAFFCSSRLTLNITRRAMRASGYCPSGRLFEAAACGAPILSDQWEGLDRFFQPGSEILVANDADDAVAALQLSDAELRRIAGRARERVLREHTATHRVGELEQLLAEAKTQAAQHAGAMPGGS